MASFQLPPTFPSDSRYLLAQELMEQAEALNQALAGKLKDPDWKANHTEVTELDRAIERSWRLKIAQIFPEDSILGEEEGATKGTNQYRWYLDPIDGTRSLARGVPLYGSMLALEKAGQVLWSLIVYPALGHALTAYRGHGAYVRAERQAAWAPARLSPQRQLASALILSSGPEYFAQAGMQDLWQKLSFAGLALRTWGDCYGYYLFASGKAEVMADAHLMPWDLAPVQIVGEELGAQVTLLRWQGQVGMVMAVPGLLPPGLLP